LDESFHPQPFDFGEGAGTVATAVALATVNCSFSARAAVAAAAEATVTEVLVTGETFSTRLTLEAVVDGTEELEPEVMIDDDGP
jgi:hypothetical protein